MIFYKQRLDKRKVKAFRDRERKRKREREREKERDKVNVKLIESEPIERIHKS